MDRRTFVKALPLTPPLPAALSGQAGEAQTGSTGQTTASAASSSAGSQAAGSQKQDVPAIAKKLATTGEPHSDMTAMGADGLPQEGFKDRVGANKQADPKAPYQKPLTQEEQDIMDGKKGPELAKIMKIVVGRVVNRFSALRVRVL